jgi:hypothetical protein
MMPPRRSRRSGWRGPGPPASRLLVLGSSTARMLGRVAFGSVADRLLHSSPLPVVLGYGTDWAGAIEEIGWADGDLLAVVLLASSSNARSATSSTCHLDSS